MQLSSYIKMALSHFKKYMIRSVLTVLGIVIGISSMIAVIALGDAGEVKIRYELEKFGTNRLFIYPKNEAIDRLYVEDVELLYNRINDIDYISPQSFGNAKLDYNGLVLSTDLVGTTKILKEVEKKAMSEGRFLNDNDVAYGRNVIVLSEEVKDYLFAEEEAAVGESVSINGKIFTVVGVEQNTSPIYSAIVSARSYIPITTFKNVFGYSNIDEISITVNKTEKMSDVKEEATEILEQKYGDSAIRTVNLGEQIKNAESIIDTFKLVINCIALISLLVGGIGIMNVMLITVSERTKEIGIRKALGAKDSSILHQFLIESILYAIIGSFFGLVVGISLAVLAANTIGVELNISIGTILASVFFAAMIGIVFGIIPAIKAAKLNPVDALMHE